MRLLRMVHAKEALAVIPASKAIDIIIKIDDEDLHSVKEICSTARQSNKRVWVDIGALSSHRFNERLSIVMSAYPYGIFLSGFTAPEDIEHLGAKLSVYEARYNRPDKTTYLIVLIDTPTAALAAPQLRPYSRLFALTWSPSFQGFKSLSCESDAWRQARAMTILSATCLQIPAIEASSIFFSEEGAFCATCVESKRQGFSAMIAQNESQAVIIDTLFGKDIDP